jgi:hypothetical protein
MWPFRSPKPECYVPKQWTLGNLVMEFNSVWCVPNKYKDPIDEAKFRKIIQRIWEAERDGFTKAEITAALNAQAPDDVIANGLKKMVKG